MSERECERLNGEKLKRKIRWKVSENNVLSNVVIMMMMGVKLEQKSKRERGSERRGNCWAT